MDWRPKIRLVMQTYAAVPSQQIEAVDALINAAVERERVSIKEQIAQSVCEGKHAGPPNGIACKACVDTEMAYLQSQVQPEGEAQHEPAMKAEIDRLIDRGGF